MSSRSEMSDVEEDDEVAAGLSPISEINSTQGILDLNFKLNSSFTNKQKSNHLR